MNPRDSDFTVGPVAPTAFVGRQLETGLILGRALRPQPPLQSLEGSSKIGRTSMLMRLRAITREEVQPDGLQLDATSLIAPLIDLTFHVHRGEDAQETILAAIAGEMKERGFEAPPVSARVEAIVGVVAAMRQLVNEGHGFLLLVDHVEHLLTSSNDDAREEWSEAATATLGELNENVPIAVLLAFGSAGPAKTLRAPIRRRKMLEAFKDLSQILNRGDVTPTTLGLLTNEEVRAFAGAATIPGVGGKAAGLTDEEIEWIVQLAGRHPLVMQNAGLKLEETRGELRLSRDELERQLADPGLQGFLIDAFRRIGPLEEADVTALNRLAAGEKVETAEELRALLAEECLIDTNDRERASMPSRAPRDALRAYLSARDATSPPAPAGGEAHAHARIPSPTLALRGTPRERNLRLTRSEHALIKVLLAADKDEFASRAALRSALGRNTADPQLTQRLSVLRGKIDTELGVPNAIENIYGQGYRLIDADRYVLLDRAISE